MGNKLSKTEEIRRLFIFNTLLPSVIISIILEYTNHEKDCKECDRLTPGIIAKLRIGFNCSLDIDESKFYNHRWHIHEAKYCVSVTEKELVKIEHLRRESGWGGCGSETLSAADFARQVVHGKLPSIVSTAELQESHKNEVRGTYDCKYNERFRRQLYSTLVPFLSLRYAKRRII